MFNVGVNLANPSFQVHVLALSEKKARTWLASTGQAPNPYLDIMTICSGEYEDWHPTSPSELVTVVQSTKFTTGVKFAIASVKARHPDDFCTAIIANGLMHTLPGLATSLKLKLYLLAPTAYYIIRTADTQHDGSTPDDEVALDGIGGSSSPLIVKLGDGIDMMGPMYRQMFKPTFEQADGQVWSNTNTGLGGEVKSAEGKKDFFIGPILPIAYEQALDSDEGLAKQRALADKESDCVKFLDTRKEKEVVYVTLGGHVQMSVKQAVAIIEGLRKYSVPWIILFREGKEKLEEALGTFDDGVITTWAPQLDIMMHRATRCVLSHGGFGTMIEGVYAGQPFITSPVISDQFLDTKVMLHLGICVGTIAINTLEGVMTRTDMEPRWPDDDGTLLGEVFERAFGTGGDEVLDDARTASRALRARMVQTKRSEGLLALENLRTEVSQPKA